MKLKNLHSVMFLMLFVVLSVTSLYSQTANMSLRNDTWDNNHIYTVDVYLLSTDPAPQELAAIAIGLVYNDAAKNGGTVSAAWVSGSTGLSNTAELPGLLINTTSGTNRVIRLTGKTPPGYGGGSMISNVSPGTRLGTLKLTNTATWAITGGNLIAFAAQSVYPSAYNIYIYQPDQTAINTNIFTGVTETSYLAGPLLPVELSSFASAAQGRTVVLNWSTKTEKNSNLFEVERSLAASTNWSTVGTVKAAGLSNSTKNYSYSDTKLQSGKYQYRLKMVDANGTFSYSSVESAEVAIPKDFAVSQNYPNPFNPSTKIDYQVPVDAKVILEVYNIAGQKVVELVNSQMSAGYYTVDFGASKLASGVYIYRLAASDLATGHNFSSIKKMMLLK
jgi:hypothetical protein